MKPPVRIAVVAASFNAGIVERLLAGCLRALTAGGVSRERVLVVRVPGSYEIPWAAQELALTGRFDAVVCLGAIVKGRTSHNERIADSVFQRLSGISLATRVPCVLGVITPNTWAQALARTRGKLNRGREAGSAAVAMAALKRAKPWSR